MSGGLIELRDVWARGVLRGVTLSIGEGVTAVVGRNGSGKTTLLRVIAGIIRPERGEVKAPERIGASWQNPYYSFYKATVLDEVQLTAGGRDKALRILAEYGLEGLADRSPFTLSAGQARLLSIILATAWSPDALLIDEPTSGLGLSERKMVAEAIRGLKVPVVIASHDLDFVLEVADWIAVIEEGSIRYHARVPEGFYREELYKHGFPKPLAVRVGEALGVVIRSVEPCWISR